MRRSMLLFVASFVAVACGEVLVRLRLDAALRTELHAVVVPLAVVGLASAAVLVGGVLAAASRERLRDRRL